VLALAKDDVVVALGARLGRRQPDLLVGRLLVDDVCADIGAEGEGEDAGLVGGCEWEWKCRVEIE
jgi:hypothetical protein